MRAKEEKHRLLIHVRPKKIILKSFLTMGQKMNNIASKKQWSWCILGAGNKTTLCMTQVIEDRSAIHGFAVFRACVLNLVILPDQ